MRVSILKLVYGAKNAATGPELRRVVPTGFNMIVQYALGTTANLGAVPTHDCDVCCAESPFMSTQDGGKAWMRAPFHISGVQVIVSHNGTQAPTGLRYAWEEHGSERRLLGRLLARSCYNEHEAHRRAADVARVAVMSLGGSRLITERS
jgi:hypothetical protein